MGIETTFQGHELIIAPDETFGIQCLFTLVEPAPGQNTTGQLLDFRRVEHRVKLEMEDTDKFFGGRGLLLKCGGWPVFIHHTVRLPAGLLRGTKLLVKCTIIPWN